MEIQVIISSSSLNTVHTFYGLLLVACKQHILLAT